MWGRQYHPQLPRGCSRVMRGGLSITLDVFSFYSGSPSETVVDAALIPLFREGCALLSANRASLARNK